MERKVGTISMGIRCPIIREGDNLVDIASKSVIEACESIGLSISNKDVIALTESIVARAQGNYATIDDIANDVKAKFNCDTLGVIFPILSRNRFAICLKGIAKGVKKIVLMLSYGKHEFTGVDYVEYYSSLIKEAGAEVEIVFANQATAILNYTKNVLTCDIHTRARTKRILKEAGATKVLGMDDILNNLFYFLLSVI